MWPRPLRYPYVAVGLSIDRPSKVNPAERLLQVSVSTATPGLVNLTATRAGMAWFSKTVDVGRSDEATLLFPLSTASCVTVRATAAGAPTPPTGTPVMADLHC